MEVAGAGRGPHGPARAGTSRAEVAPRRRWLRGGPGAPGGGSGAAGGVPVSRWLINHGVFFFVNQDCNQWGLGGGGERRPRGSGSKAEPGWNCVFDRERGRRAGPWPRHAGGTPLVTVYTHTLDVQVRQFYAIVSGGFFTFLIKLVLIDKLPSVSLLSPRPGEG